MKKLNLYIIEKLKIDKDTKLENPYEGIPLKDTLSHLLYDIYRENTKLSMYDVIDDDKEEITIILNKEIKSYIDEIVNQIKELIGFYNIIGIMTKDDPDNLKIIVQYEKSK